MSFRVDHTPPLYAGTSLCLICIVTLDPNVDNSETVSIEFGGLNYLPENRVYLSAMTDLSHNKYVRNVTISPVSVKDSGDYTCVGTVNGGSTAQHATSSKGVNTVVTSE